MIKASYLTTCTHLPAQTAGIFLFAFSFILCICGTSFIGLCCGDFPPIIKILSIGGCFITGAGAIIYIGELPLSKLAIKLLLQGTIFSH